MNDLDKVIRDKLKSDLDGAARKWLLHNSAAACVVDIGDELIVACGAKEDVRKILGEDWRTIDSAPKDGTAILIYMPPREVTPNYTSKEYVTISHWYVHYRNGKPDTLREPEWKQPDMYAGFGSYEGPIYPTHWMPMPIGPMTKYEGKD